MTVMVIYGLTMAGAVLVEERTHSSAQTGLVILSAIMPAFLGSLVAGVVVDRWGRVRVLVASHLARALAALAFWASIQHLPSGLVPVSVYAVNAAVALFSQFAMPSELALVPDLVEGDQLLSANALLQLSVLAAEGVGIVLFTPLVIKVAGEAAVGLIGGLFCVLALVLVSALPRDRAVGHQPEAGRVNWAELWSDLKEGWRTIAGDGVLRLVAVQATLAATLLLVLLSLGPGLASRYLGLGAEDTPFLLLPGGLGFVLGAFLMGPVAGRLSRPALIALGLVGLGFSLGLLAVLSGAAGRLWLVPLLLLGGGLALALIIIPARTVLQERPPSQLRGRVIAAQLALANAAAVVPLLLGGALADRLGIQPVMGLLGLLALGAGVAGLRHVKR
jgi:MFS family permease